MSSSRSMVPGQAAVNGEVDFALAAGDDAALAALATRLAKPARPALLLGPPGTGKSTLARRLAAAFEARGEPVRCIGADPGSPGFGVPGAVCLGEWRDGEWRLLGLEALCTLDAGRFRLPLAAAVRRLAAQAAGPGPVLLDGPGVVRGVAGAELLAALVDAAGIGAIVALVREDRPAWLAAELAATGLPVLRVAAPQEAHRPGKAARARGRTRRWDAYLQSASPHAIDVSRMPVLGTPPPRDAYPQWRGRQAALVDERGWTVAFGEIADAAPERLMLRLPVAPRPALALLVRDARRDERGLLNAAGPDAADAVRYAAPADVLPDAASATGPRPVVRAAVATAALVNGVLGDPLLHLRLHHRRRSLLFDLGEAGRLPAKIAHQVSDVFLSHAHMDHIAGFLWLVRSRMGDFPALRIHGPPGTAGHVRGLLAGILWDRIEARGPRFAVAELHGETLRCFDIQAGGEAVRRDDAPAPGGLLLTEPELSVRAAALDHGHGTRVLAFALDTPRTLNVRKERLAALGVEPGPWLTQLKTAASAGDTAAVIVLPDGREEKAGALARELLIDGPGTRIAYATDLADSAENRGRLASLAAGAHTFFCEASFRLADAAQAERTGHLTTRACGEIAAAARAERLVPFHFSRRYEDDLVGAYDEVRAAFPRTITPPLRDR